MNLLHFIILVLLGLFSPSANAVPHQTIALTADNILQDLDRTVGKELAARQGFPSDLLLQYDLKCALDKENTEFAPDSNGNFLTAGYCKNWFDCKPDGTKTSKEEVYDPHVYKSPLKTKNKAWQVKTLDMLPWEVGANQLSDRCEKWCECVLVDEPKLHYADNFGCVNPIGEIIQGNFGSVARDASTDALVMEAYNGPPRKE